MCNVRKEASTSNVTQSAYLDVLHDVKSSQVQSLVLRVSCKNKVAITAFERFTYSLMASFPSLVCVLKCAYYKGLGKLSLTTQ